MRADFDQEKKRAVNVATRSLERDLERLKADHATEIEEMLENHKQELSENKKKQWVSRERGKEAGVLRPSSFSPPLSSPFFALSEQGRESRGETF